MKYAIYIAAAAAGLSAASVASAASAAIEAAKDACVIGEQADGYLGVIESSKASEELKRDVRANNQQRKAIYAEFAERNGLTIEVAAALFAERNVNQAPSGQCVRDEGGTWLKKP